MEYCVHASYSVTITPYRKHFGMVNTRMTREVVIKRKNSSLKVSTYCTVFSMAFHYNEHYNEYLLVQSMLLVPSMRS